MADAGDAGSQKGLELAEELFGEVRRHLPRHLSSAFFGRYDDMAALVKRLKAKQN
jgi:hypothetical protein